MAAPAVALAQVSASVEASGPPLRLAQVERKSPESAAQAYPSKPIRIVVPAVPGGGTDILARLLSPRLTELLGQSVIIDNRAGASTNIGTEFVARAAPDGYTVLIATTPHAVNPTLFRKLNFDPLGDFTMISQLALTQTVLVV
ncbi:MAG TPA: tripartite tricarboxylate transporter substrate-binding protein, partial [Burkholderiales bacterium]|nr:tripartite tricarboxylate transporter substrate-binding protein [Burkholderiales bacterium]